MDNEDRKVKIRGTIIFILIIAIIGGYFFFAKLCHTQKFGTPIEVSATETIDESADVKPASNSTHIPLASEFVEISDLTGDYKYIFYDNITNSNDIVVTAVTKENFEKIYQETPYIKEITEQTKNIKPNHLMEYIEQGAIEILSHLTRDSEEEVYPRLKDGYKSSCFIYNNTTLEGSALPGKFDKGSPSKTFAYEELDLQIENIEIKKIIGSKAMAEMDSTVAVIAESDVTTISNKGKYSKQKWIPNEGKTERIAFVITYGTYTNSGDDLNPIIYQIQDIGILNTTPEMALQMLLSGGYLK